MGSWLSSSSEADGFEELQRIFTGMLVDGRSIFEAASGALLGNAEPEEVRTPLFETDERINHQEQEMRRKIVVHGSVHGVRSFPSLLVLMSLGKDAERIGDYGKNIFDLAVARPDLGGDEDRAELAELRGRILDLLERAREVYQAEDADGARQVLEEADSVENACDSGVGRNLAVRGRNCAGQVLAHRYFKRVASHVANVVTSLVVPLDKLDFFDED